MVRTDGNLRSVPNQALPHLSHTALIAAGAAAVVVVVLLIVLIAALVRRGRRRRRASMEADGMPVGVPGRPTGFEPPAAEPAVAGPAAPAAMEAPAERPPPLPGLETPPQPAEPVPSYPTAPDGDLPLRVAGRSWHTETAGTAVRTVRGLVTSPEGTPIAGAALTLINVTGGQVGGGSTSSAGEYQIRVPAEGQYVLIARAAGHEPRAATVSVAAPSARLDLTLTSAIALNGTVRWADGTPAHAAMVILTSFDGSVVASQPTNPRGGYHINELAGGIYTLTVAAPGHRPIAVLVDVPDSGITKQDVTLPERRTQLSGTARHDGDGRPLPDVRVSLLDETGQVLAVTWTDADGRYGFDAVPPGPHTVLASGYPPVAGQLTVPEGTEYEHDVVLGWQADRDGTVGGRHEATGTGQLQPGGYDTHEER